MKRKITNSDVRTIGLASLSEFCGLGGVSHLRSDAQRLASSNKNLSAKQVADTVNKVLSERMQRCATIMHERVINRMNEDCEITFDPAFVKPSKYIRWVDFILDVGYRESVTARLSSGSFTECMYIRQSGLLANELISNHKRNMELYQGA